MEQLARLANLSGIAADQLPIGLTSSGFFTAAQKTATAAPSVTLEVAGAKLDQAEAETLEIKPEASESKMVTESISMPLVEPS